MELACRTCAYPVCQYKTSTGHKISCPRHKELRETKRVKSLEEAIAKAKK